MNHAQSVSPVPAQIFRYNAQHHFTADFDGPGFRYQATLPDGSALPDWLQFDTATADFSGDPNESDPGMLTVRLAIAGNGKSAEDLFAIMVSPGESGNAASALTSKPTPRRKRPSVQPFRFDASTAFAPVHTETAGSFTATALNSCALPDWLEFDEASGVFSGTPSLADLGSVSVIVVATHQDRADNRIVTIEIDEVGDQVVATVSPETPEPDESEIFVYDTDQLFSDAGLGRLLVRSIDAPANEESPTWLRLNALTGQLWALPHKAVPGKCILPIAASDGRASATRSLLVNAEPGANGGSIISAGPLPAAEPILETTEPSAAHEAKTDAVPQWLLFDDGSGEFHGAPPRSTQARLDLEDHAVSASASDDFVAQMEIDFSGDSMNADITISISSGPLAPLPTDKPLSACPEIDYAAATSAKSIVAKPSEAPWWVATAPTRKKIPSKAKPHWLHHLQRRMPSLPSKRHDTVFRNK